jgi:hypothetical protein
MSRTGLATIKIRNNGTPLGVIGFSVIDLTGSLSATDAGNNIATMTGSGGGTGTNVATETLTATQSGTSITLDLTALAHTFVAVEVVWRNGQALTPISSWSLVGSTVTVVNADAGDVYLVQYTY